MASRHRWLKLRLHVYICRVCGMGRVNAQVGVEWRTTYHAPDGRSFVASTRPPCVVGARTATYLAKYRAALGL